MQEGLNINPKSQEISERVGKIAEIQRILPKVLHNSHMLEGNDIDELLNLIKRLEEKSH